VVKQPAADPAALATFMHVEVEDAQGADLAELRVALAGDKQSLAANLPQQNAQCSSEVKEGINRSGSMMSSSEGLHNRHACFQATYVIVVFCEEAADDQFQR
jgi:hypothetical protein